MSPTSAGPIDWSRLDEMRRMEAEGMPGLAARLVRTYLENSARLIRELHAAMGAGDADGVRRAAHSIKSTAANIGATALSQLGRTLEHAAQETGWVASGDDADRISVEYQRVVIALGERFGA